MRKITTLVHLPGGGTEVSGSGVTFNQALRVAVQDSLPEGQTREFVTSIASDPAVQRAVYESGVNLNGSALRIGAVGGVMLSFLDSEDDDISGSRKERQAAQEAKGAPVVFQLKAEPSVDQDSELGIAEVATSVEEILLEKGLTSPELARHSCDDRLGSKRLARFQATAPVINIPEYCKTEETDPSTSGHAGMPGASDAGAIPQIPKAAKYVSYVVTSVLFLAAVYVACGDVEYQHALSTIVLEPAFRYCVKKMGEGQ